MLPKNKLGRRQHKKLKVYAGRRAPAPGAEARTLARRWPQPRPSKRYEDSKEQRA